MIQIKIILSYLTITHMGFPSMPPEPHMTDMIK